MFHSFYFKFDVSANNPKYAFADSRNAGDLLYVVDSGELDCTKSFSKGAPPKHLKVFHPGDSFGELSLLYNTPRAANIIGKTKGLLYALDRETFLNIVKDAAIKKREKYEDFLKSVEILKSLDPYEVSNVADAVKSRKYAKDEYIIRQGEEGDCFYFLEKGNVVATKTDPNTGTERVVYQYSAGDYFGELALIQNTTRAANVVAKVALSSLLLSFGGNRAKPLS